LDIVLFIENNRHGSSLEAPDLLPELTQLTLEKRNCLRRLLSSFRFINRSTKLPSAVLQAGERILNGPPPMLPIK
jgi:hypothetical protein